MLTHSQKRDLVFKTILSLIAVNGAFGVAYYLAFGDIFFPSSPISRANYPLLLINANLVYLLINLFGGPRLTNVLGGYLLFVIAYLSMIIILQGYELSRFFHSIFLSLLFVSVVLVKYSNLVQVFGRYLLPNILEQKVVLIGDAVDLSIVHHVDSRPGNFRCLGILSDKPQSPDLEEFFLGKIDSLEKYLSENIVDEVLISTSLLSVEKIESIINIAGKYHANASILPPYFNFLATQSYRTSEWMGVPVISVYPSKLAISSHRMAKRALDMGISLFFLAVIFPILCVIIVPAIWLNNRGPIFFRQLRKGYKQQPFTCYKFRTMKETGAADSTTQARRSDPRTTRVGEKLRVTSLDEVPQFINVLLGHMSLVGPRPHMVEHDKMFETHISRYNVRFVTKPGITGWAQINGYRGNVEGNPDLLEKRIEYDLWYIKNWSMWLDIRIIGLTAYKLLLKGDRNAY